MSFPGSSLNTSSWGYAEPPVLAVDSMGKRRGGYCARRYAVYPGAAQPRTSRCSWALVRHGDYRRWLEATTSTSLTRQVDGKFTASFFCCFRPAQQPDRRRPAPARVAGGTRRTVIPRRGRHRDRHRLAERSGRDGAMRQNAGRSTSSASSTRASGWRACRATN